MGIFIDRSKADQQRYMDRVHNDATGLRNQISQDSLPGGAGGLPADWVDRFFRWYAEWSSFYWENRPKSGTNPGWPWLSPIPPDDSDLLPANDTVWAETGAYEAALIKWAKQYEQLSGRHAQPHSPPVPPEPSPENRVRLGVDMGGVGTAVGIGLGAALLLLLARR